MTTGAPSNKDRYKRDLSVVVATLSIASLIAWAYCAITNQRLRLISKKRPKFYVITNGKAVRRE